MDDEEDLDKMSGKEEKRLWSFLQVSGYLVGPCSEMANAEEGHWQSHQDQDAYQTSEGG